MSALIDTHHRHRRPRPAARHAGFSITELLVVIGIIVLLAGLLLVALGKARGRALETTTLSTMQALARACDTFQSDHGSYPGVIPERVLANDPQITSTQNALLHLLGGYRVLNPTEAAARSGPAWDEFELYDASIELTFAVPGGSGQEWRLRIDPDRIGEGPFINGRPYEPYLSLGSNELRLATSEDDFLLPAGLENSPSLTTFENLPHLFDAWGHPIVYLRQLRTTGPLVGAPDERPQFLIETALHYFTSTQLGNRQENQSIRSILSPDVEVGSPIDLETVRLNLAQLIRHPAFGPRLIDEDTLGELTARGAYVLISAGADGVYFSSEDGAGRPGTAVTNIAEDSSEFEVVPTILAEYDDVVSFGGG